VAFQDREIPSVSAGCGSVAGREASSDDGELNERAAILEYHGRHPRAEAERLARAEVQPTRRATAALT
jgi:hypothetical protein